MGFELKYYQCPKCAQQKLAKNLDNGSFVCDNTEGGCTHFIKGSENYEPRREIIGKYEQRSNGSSNSYSVSLDVMDKFTDILRDMQNCCSGSQRNVEKVRVLFMSIGIKLYL